MFDGKLAHFLYYISGASIPRSALRNSTRECASSLSSSCWLRLLILQWLPIVNIYSLAAHDWHQKSTSRSYHASLQIGLGLRPLLIFVAAVLLSFGLVLSLWLLELNRSRWRGHLVWFWASKEVILDHEFIVLIEWRRLVGHFVEGRLAPVKVSVQLVGPEFDAAWDDVAWWVASPMRHPSS